MHILIQIVFEDGSFAQRDFRGAAVDQLIGFVVPVVGFWWPDLTWRACRCKMLPILASHMCYMVVDLVHI
jgi:hypothetical protein